MEDAANTAGRTGGLSVATFGGLGTAGLAYASIELFDIGLGAGGDRLDITGSSTGQTRTRFGGGEDVANIFQTNGRFLLSTGPDNDMVNVGCPNDLGRPTDDLASRLGDRLTITGDSNGQDVFPLRAGGGTTSDPQSPLFAPPMNRYDVSGDGAVTPLDSLLVINYLDIYRSSTPRSNGVSRSGEGETPRQRIYWDVNSDLHASPIDAFLVVNRLNMSAEGEAISDTPDTVAIDAVPERWPEIYGSHQSNGSRWPSKHVATPANNSNPPLALALQVGYFGEWVQRVFSPFAKGNRGFGGCRLLPVRDCAGRNLGFRTLHGARRDRLRDNLSMFPERKPYLGHQRSR